MLQGSGIMEHKRLHRLQLPRRNRLLGRVGQLNKTISEGEMAACTKLVHNSSAAAWLCLERALQTLNYRPWLVPLCPLGTFLSMRPIYSLSSSQQFWTIWEM